ncbi:MAG: 1-deoxy-D-xylulose-5-phosphate reductoisomerase [Desulfuromonadia bacterium]
MKRLGILGSTGSIGTSTLELVSLHPESYRVVALSAGTNIDILARQIERFRPEVVSVLDEAHAVRLAALLGDYKPEIFWGVTGMLQVAVHPDVELVVAAVVGAAGLVPTYGAIEAGKDVALANKETLVTAGHLIIPLVREKNVRLLPVDSEHSAIHQSLAGHRHEDVRRLILTASGGPFLDLPLASLASVSVEDALRHPNWSMGRKITIDSATMMNKGLEVIEARWLFDIPADRIDVLIHPQSIIHSMVEYLDGCVMAQLGVPDMRAPIAYALAHPVRIETSVPFLDLASVGSLTFREPEPERFPCLSLAYESLAGDQTLPAVMNGANEVAVAAFLQGRIPFTRIHRVIRETMDAHRGGSGSTIEEILAADRWSREFCRSLIARGDQ